MSASASRNDVRPWLPADRTGGPLDALLDQLLNDIPELVVHRRKVMHPADDDNVYFLGTGKGLADLQVDTADHGRPPFLIEADHRPAVATSDLDEAATLIAAWLRELA